MVVLILVSGISCLLMVLICWFGRSMIGVCVVVEVLIFIWLCFRVMWILLFRWCMLNWVLSMWMLVEFMDIMKC